MRLKSAFVWLAAVIVGVSLGQAQAATVTVDDFLKLGTQPASGNQWGTQPAYGVMGGARNFTKMGGNQWRTPSSSPAPTPPVPAGTLRLQSSGADVVATNQYQFTYNGNPTSNSATFSPKVDVSSMTYLNVSGDFVTQSNTQAIVRLASGSGTVSTVTQTGGQYDATYKVWRFKLSDFSPTLNLAQLQRVQVQLNALGIVNNIDKIYFSDYYVPEPSTFALAGLAAVGLVIARRRKK